MRLLTASIFATIVAIECITRKDLVRPAGPDQVCLRQANEQIAQGSWVEDVSVVDDHEATATA